MEELSTDKLGALLRLGSALRLMDNCNKSVTLKLFEENKDTIAWLNQQFPEQIEEIVRLRMGLDYLVHRAGQKPCEIVNLEGIASETLAGHDYSDRFGAASDNGNVVQIGEA